MGKAVSQHEVHDQVVALCHVGDHRALPLAMEQFEHHPSPATMRLVALAARSRGLVLPSRHHPDHLAVRFTYSLESAISEVMDGLSADQREDCLAVLGRGSRRTTASEPRTTS